MSTAARRKTSGAIVFGSPISVGHVRPLMPLARRLVQRGFVVVWAISGDDNEPASVWRAPLSERFADSNTNLVPVFPRSGLPPNTVPLVPTNRRIVFSAATGWERS